MKRALGALIFCEKNINASRIFKALVFFSQNCFVKKNQRLKDSRGVDFFSHKKSMPPKHASCSSVSGRGGSRHHYVTAKTLLLLHDCYFYITVTVTAIVLLLLYYL